MNGLEATLDDIQMQIVERDRTIAAAKQTEVGKTQTRTHVEKKHAHRLAHAQRHK
jgi:hypothetical protein